MTFLLVGFDSLDTERWSSRLRDGGHAVLGATGPQSARTLASSSLPDAVFVPEGDEGREAWAQLGDLVDGVRVVALGPQDDPIALLGSLSPAVATAIPETVPVPPGIQDPMTALPGQLRGAGLPMGARAAAPSPAAAQPTIPGAPDLESKLEAVRFGDYHDILEVDPGATAYVIRQQHEHLIRFYTPSGWPGPVRALEIPLLAEVSRGIEDAYAVLSDPQLRGRYEAALTAAADARRGPE